MIEYVEYDDRTDPKRTVAGLTMMIDMHDIQWVVGPQTSHCTFAAQPISEAQHICMISGAAATPLTREGIKYFWSATGNVGIRAAALMPYYSDVLKVKTVSVVTENYAYALSMRTDGIYEFERKGVDIVFDELFESPTTDFSTIIARAKVPDPDVLYINASPARCILLVKQVYESGWPVQIISLTELISDDLFKVTGPAADGVMGMGGLDFHAIRKGDIPQNILDEMGTDIDWINRCADRWIEDYGEHMVRFAPYGSRFQWAYTEAFTRSGTVTDMDQFMSVFRGMEFDAPTWKMKVLPNQLFTTWIPISVYFESDSGADNFILLAVNKHVDDWMENWESVIVNDYKTIDQLRVERGY
jgi:hypothetical protein